MTLRAILLPGLMGVFAAAGILQADQTLYFDSVSGKYGGYNYPAQSYGGPYYLSPYFGHVDNQPAGSEVLFCLDFDHYINVGDHTTAVFRTLPENGTFQDADYQFGNISAGSAAGSFVNGPLPTTSAGTVSTGANISSLSAYQRYEAAIFLLYEELTAATPPPVQNTRLRAVYQYAMWALFLQNGPPEGVGMYRNAVTNISKNDHQFASDVNTLVTAAYNEVTNVVNQSFLASLLPFFTIVDATSNPSCLGCKYQEFLSPTVAPAGLPLPTPEPASVVLLLSLVAALGWNRYRRNSA